MITLILATATAFLASIFAIPSIITVAKLKNLYDKPEERKIHTLKIPRLGGMAIFISFTFAILLFGDFTNILGAKYIGAALIMLLVSGLKDDIIILSPMKKLGTQLIAAGLVSYLTPVRLTDFHGVLGIHEIPLSVSIPLTMFTLIVITNSFNLIDGADGLAGGLGLLMSLTFAIYFVNSDDHSWALMAFGLSGALLGFLFFNYNPAKIFLGDAGSLTTGFLLAIFAIHFIEMNISNINRIDSAPGIAIAILIVPLYDTLRVFILRTSKKKSPFQADRNHIHHWLMRIGMNHREVSFTLVAVNLVFILVAFSIKDNPAYLVTSIIVGLSIIVGQIPAYFYRHKLSDLEADDSALLELQENLKGKSNLVK